MSYELESVIELVKLLAKQYCACYTNLLQTGHAGSFFVGGAIAWATLMGVDLIIQEHAHQGGAVTTPGTRVTGYPALFIHSQHRYQLYHFLSLE